MIICRRNNQDMVTAKEKGLRIASKYYTEGDGGWMEEEGAFNFDFDHYDYATIEVAE